MSKTVALMLFALLALSSLVMVGSVSAQSIPRPSVPEFTVDFFDNSYDVPPTYEIDPYTGETVPVEGHHVENKTIQLTIKNQPHSSSYDYYYNVRVKGHFSEIWYSLFASEYSPVMSGSEYTVITFSSSGDDVFRNRASVDFEAPSGGEVDFQVQAFVGYYEYHYDTSALPFSSGWIFKTVDSGWSETITLAIPESPLPSPDPTPTPYPTEKPQQPGQDMAAGAIFAVTSIVVFLGLLVYFIKIR